MFCDFKNPATGELVKANVPLHPVLVEYQRDDGSIVQIETADFTRQFVRQLPPLPQVIVTELATEEDIIAGAAAVSEMTAAATEEIARPDDPSHGGRNLAR